MEKDEGRGMTRAFICIKMPEEVVKEIARLQELLGNWKFIGKMTELENLHLTLKFLGEIDEKKLSEVKVKLSGIKFNLFEAKLRETGVFGHRGNPRIVWAKIGGEGIFELHKKVDDALDGLFEREHRFMSHMTFARLRYVEDKQGFFKHLSSLWVKEILWDVKEFYLMKSELRQNGPVYTTIAEYKLHSSEDKADIEKKHKIEGN